MKIAILGIGNASVRAAAVIEEVRKTHPDVEIVFVDETDDEGMCKIKGEEFHLLGFNEAPSFPPDLRQFDYNYDGITRKGKGERKRNKANRWR